ncbi:MAG: hypothetical protein FWE88_01695 [Phycisphaerae bacterium]|nr:hypothetical protein [Phycisphaerae bacterium]
MPGRPTDHAHIDLTQLSLDVPFRRSGGKVIWEPRIGAWYTDRLPPQQWFPMPERYQGMSLPALYRDLGCANRVYDFCYAIRNVEDPRVRIERNDLAPNEYEVTIHTPVGRQYARYRVSPNSWWHEPIKWPVASPEEMRVAAWRERHRTWVWDQAMYEKECEEWKGLGAVNFCIPRTTTAKLYLEEMGIANTIYALMDWPAVCEEYFDALEESQSRLIDVINASPILRVNFGDNLHSGTTSPEIFARYILPVYQRRSEQLHRAGKFVFAHWDGNCKGLLEYARDTGMDGIEAITPIPQGDVTLEETKAALGDMVLIDGIPAVFFDTHFTEQTLIDCVKKILDLFAPNLCLGISDEMSATGDLERIRLVTQVIDEYNAGK